MNGLSEIMRLHLTQAGWSEERSIDTGECERAIISAGLPLHLTVVEFVRKFGGLKVEFPVLVPDGSRWDANRDGKEWFLIDPIKAIADCSGEWFKYYSDRAGKALCPIGEAHRGHATLLMAEDGTVYGGYDEEFWEEGKSGIEALENIRAHSDYRDRK
jgi:hypothetical protein